MRIGRTLPPAAAPIYPEDIISGLKGLIRGQKEIKRFEAELKDYYNVKHCFLVSSGKAALTIILKALHQLYPERNEVLLPAFTCYSVPSAILRAGLKVKLCDINPKTLDFDSEQLQKILSKSNSHGSQSSILAVIPTHLLGLPVDVEGLKKITDNKITIIEDAAQAMGGMLREKKLGTLGDAGFFSLGRGKSISTVEGGIILTNKAGLAKNISKQMNCLPSYSILEVFMLTINAIILSVFLNPSLFWFPKSLPFLKLGQTIFGPEFPIKKLSSFQAGLSNDWRKKIKYLNSVRIKNIKYWNSVFNSKKILTYKVVDKPLLRFPLRIIDSQLLDTILKKNEQFGLGIMKTYPNSINAINELQTFFKNQDYPVASTTVSQLITLPVHSYVSTSDNIKIMNLIQKSLKTL